MLMQLLGFSVVLVEQIRTELACILQKARDNTIIGEIAHTWVSNIVRTLPLFNKYRHNV